MAINYNEALGGTNWVIIHPKVTRPRKRKSHSSAQSTYRDEKVVPHTTKGGRGLIAELREGTKRMRRAR